MTARRGVRSRSHDVAQDLDKTLTALRAYSHRDPGFKAAIATAAKAEAEHSHDDPVDGAVVIGELVDGRPVEEPGPVTAGELSTHPVDAIRVARVPDKYVDLDKEIKD